MARTNYFSHDAGARNDSKIVRLRMRHGAAGYGVYFMLLERLREESNYQSTTDYEMIAYDLRVDTELVRSVVEDFGLFCLAEDGTTFQSHSFNERMSVKDEKTNARSEAGRKGMARRWAKNNSGDEITNSGDGDNNVISSDNNVITKGGDGDNNVITNSRKAITSKGKESKESKERKSPLPAAPAHVGTREAEPVEVVEADILPAPTISTAKPRQTTPVSPPAATDREAAWLAELQADRQFLQTLAMQTRAPNEQVILQALRDFHAEARAKDIRHADHGDYRRHAFDWIRRHLEILRQNEQRTAPHPATRLQPTCPRGETDDEFRRRIVTTVAAASAAPPQSREPTSPLW